MCADAVAVDHLDVEVCWQYPEDRLIALRQQNQTAEAAAPIPTEIDLAAINFRYALQAHNKSKTSLAHFLGRAPAPADGMTS